jgi:hypothetical protein
MLTVKDFKHERRGASRLKVSGKGEKRRYVPLHGVAKDLIDDYLKEAGHGIDDAGVLFRPLRNAKGGRKKAITPDGVYKLLRHYSAALGFGIGVIFCVRQPLPTPSITGPTLLRSRSGSGMPTSRRPASTITGRPGQKRVRRSRWHISWGRCPSLLNLAAISASKASKIFIKLAMSTRSF